MADERPATFDDINRIHERLDQGFTDVGRAINAQATKTAEMIAGCRSCQSKLTRCETAIFGNGRPGLQETVQQLTDAVKGHDASFADIKAKYWGGLSKLWMLVSAGAVAGFSAWLGHTLK